MCVFSFQQTPLGSFSSDDDSLVLEDESGRVLLNGPGISSASLVSGAKGSVHPQDKYEWLEWSMFLRRKSKKAFTWVSERNAQTHTIECWRRPVYFRFIVTVRSSRRWSIQGTCNTRTHRVNLLANIYIFPSQYNISSIRTHPGDRLHRNTHHWSMTW